MQSLYCKESIGIVALAPGDVSAPSCTATTSQEHTKGCATPAHACRVHSNIVMDTRETEPAPGSHSPQ